MNNAKWDRKMTSRARNKDGSAKSFPNKRAPHVFMPGVIPRELGAFLKQELRK